jgi:glutamate-5-semialdehyde dehydrogenase
MASEVETIARRARAAARAIQSLSGAARNDALASMGSHLAGARAALLAANDKDKAAAVARLAEGDIAPALVKRLDLSGRKFDGVLEGVRSVVALADPVGVVSLARRMDTGLDLFRVSCPIGVVAVIFEARPEAAVQIAALAVKSGNAVILKGGKEGEESNKAIVECIRGALRAADFPEDAVQLVATRDQVRELLRQDAHVDLIIPRGSNSLVRYITENTKIPVMGHADGICAVYLGAAADVAKACAIAVDAKAQYPSVCNAAETLLVDRAALGLLAQVGQAMAKAGVQLRADAEARAVLDAVDGLAVAAASEEDFRTEFLDLIMAVKVVDGVDAAVQHINQHGSGHTDCIVTEDGEAASRFLAGVDSAGVFHNASTRFADGFRYGFGAEVGVSTHRTHARGPVGLEGLMIYKYKLLGSGQTVAPYADGAKVFLHEEIDPSELLGR